MPYISAKDYFLHAANIDSCDQGSAQCFLLLLLCCFFFNWYVATDTTGLGPGWNPKGDSVDTEGNLWHRGNDMYVGVFL